MIDVNLFVRDVNLFVRVLGTMTHSLCSNLFCPFARVRTIYNNSNLCGVARSSPKVTMQLAAWMAWNAVLLRACVHVSCICKVLTQLWVDLQGQIEEQEQLTMEATNQLAKLPVCHNMPVSTCKGASKQDRWTREATQQQLCRFCFIPYTSWMTQCYTEPFVNTFRQNEARCHFCCVHSQFCLLYTSDAADES